MNIENLTITEILKMVGAVSAIFGLLEGYVKIRSKENKIESAMRAILHDLLISKYRELIARDKTLIIDRQNWANLYQQYKALGGNGALEKLNEEVMKLPTEVVK